MATLKKYDITGKELGEHKLDKALISDKGSDQSIKEYIVAMRKNARQWSANTKDKSEVACSGKKPHPQKGTGKARQGSIVSPQYRGGGVVFGPKPKFDQHVRINKKERRQAIRALLSEKIEAGGVKVLAIEDLKEPKTKEVANFLKNIELSGQRVLVLGTETLQTPHIAMSLRNIPRAQYRVAANINGYDAILHPNIVVLEHAMEEFVAVLKRGEA
ncbi:MAG: 50S ribosomal protein L4 [Simkaniaceae bacterium]|nr:50S ribosomal protein L4 [Simkaniaceae bacterium]